MEDIGDFIELVRKIADKTGVTLPSGFAYRYAPYTCWKCEKNILVFKWCHGRLEGDIEKPPNPIPKTIQKKYTATSEETYWANTCPYCENVQGDWFLSVEPDSPFFTLHDVDDSKDSFERDMASITDYYYEMLAYDKEVSENEDKQEKLNIKENPEPKQKSLW